MVSVNLQLCLFLIVNFVKCFSPTQSFKILNLNVFLRAIHKMGIDVFKFNSKKGKRGANLPHGYV